MEHGAMTDATDTRVVDDFAAVFTAQFARMVRLAALLGADDPEDIAQEAFARLETRFERLPGQSTIAYLRTTVVNLTRSRLRHLRVVRRVRHELPLVESAEFLAVVRDDHRRLVDALSRLSRRQREVVVLRYWMDFSEREIAQTLGVRPGTVKSTASSALAALHKALGDDRD
jgi:RNA polymerase sigma factor (sigma-70 family)